ncbi:MAG TPA: hypothetical protein ENN97_08870 [Phycisphaerales bacterium]|nr:hypothetical protein [Phycisphaerales bacterium]
MRLLKQCFKPAQRGHIGLDIGSGAVKLVALRPGTTGWSATGAAWADIAPFDPEDKAGQYAHTLDALRDCIKQTSAISVRHVVCGLAGPDVVVRGFSFPMMPQSQIEKAVHFEAQQVCPMDMRSSVLDYQLLESATGEGQTPKKLSGVLVVGVEQTISERCRLVKEAGAKTALIDADGLAALNCLSALDDLDRYHTAALIDIGRHSTHIILLGADGLPFVRDLNMGVQTIIEQICQTLKSDPDTVRDRLWGASKKPIPDDMLMAFHHAARGLVMSINETLKYYASREKGQSVQKVYLCGGGAQISLLVELLCDALPTETAVFDPFETIHVDAGIPGADLLNTRGPAFTAATGLAMRTI